MKEFENDFELMQPKWRPDLICNNCDFETDFEKWYCVNEYDDDENIKRKLNRPEICPKCSNKLERV